MSTMPLFDAPVKIQTVTGITPRPYQEKAIEATIDSWDYSPGALVRLMTGGGKTITASLIIDQWLQRGPEYRAIVLAHERQLVWQFADEIEDCLKIRPAIEMGATRCSGKDLITVASRQTLYVRDKGGDHVSRMYKFRNQEFNWLVVMDECHRWARKLKSVAPIIEWFEENPDSRRLGLTATPERTDGTTIESLFPTIASDYRMHSHEGPNAVDDGWSVEFDQRFITVKGVDFKGIKTLGGKNGDFRDDDLERLLATKEQLIRLVDPMVELVEDRSTLIFSPTVAMAKAVTAHLNAEAGCTVSKSLDGSVAEVTRKEVYQQHQNEEFQFLSVCGLCVAGDTLVLTDCGEIPIKDVTAEMKIWDGVEFVSHGGVIYKGEKPVIEYSGLVATEDHHVKTNQGWKKLSDCKRNRLGIKLAGIGGVPIRESDCCYRRGAEEWQEQEGSVRDEVRHLRQSEGDVGIRNKKCGPRVQELLPVVRDSKLAFDEMSLCEETLRKFKRPFLQGLWRQGNRVPVFIPSSDGEMDCGKSGTAQRTYARQEGKQQALRAWKYSLGNAQRTGVQQKTSEEWILQVAERNQKKEDVYDILNCGPRNQFTANGLIIHNCREGYNDPNIRAVAIFRPTKSKPLAEQMKGRGVRPLRGLVDQFDTAEERKAAIAASSKKDCMIIDLVGVTGLADCATTAHIYAEGQSDEVVDWANQLMIEGETDVRRAMDQAVLEVEEEHKRLAKEAKEAQEEQERAEAARRARLNMQVSWTEDKVHAGQSSSIVRFFDHAGKELSTKKQRGYLRWKGITFDENYLSKGGASRMIGQLAKGMDPSEVQHLTRTRK